MNATDTEQNQKDLSTNVNSIMDSKMGKLEEKKVWFVCQGISFKKDRGMKFLWAPRKGKDNRSRFHWDNLRKVKKGDIIFNYSEKKLKGISLAISEPYPAKNPKSNAQWEEDGYRVDIQLIPLDPNISIKQLMDKKNQFDHLLSDVNHKPFNENNSVNQGYLFEFSKEAGKLIRDIYGKDFGNKTMDDFFDNTNTKPKPMSNKDIIIKVHQFIESKGFKYDYEEIANFYLALKVKPFVILAGISGTGKTQLPRKFASAIGMEKDQVIQIPVRPDWTDGSDLLGYVGIDSKFQPKDLTMTIINANSKPEKPYFFILDEMNLARVEHYFSDFLSVIETREWKDDKTISTDPILRDETLKNAVNGSDYKALGWPQNLYLVGTVNMDETTHAFSRKVLDRANSIEMNKVDLDWINLSSEKIDPLEGIDNSFFITPFLGSIDLSDKNKAAVQEEVELLKKVNQILEEADLHFAYRVRDEVAFYLILNKEYELMDPTTAMDFQLVQKVLPRIHGSSDRIQKVLVELFNLLEGTDYKNDGFEYSSIDGKIEIDKLKYSRASRKILFMLKRFDNDRFTSFWL